MLVETSVDLTAQVFPFLGREHLSYSPVRESETPITIWGKTKLTLRIGRVSRCLFSLCLSSFLNNLKILVELWVVAQTQYERALSVMINGISSVNALLCLQNTNYSPSCCPNLYWCKYLTIIQRSTVAPPASSPTAGWRAAGPLSTRSSPSGARRGWRSPGPRTGPSVRRTAGGVTLYPGVMVSTEEMVEQGRDRRE